MTKDKIEMSPTMQALVQAAEEAMGTEPNGDPLQGIR